MTTVITRGAASAQALGYAARSTAANYIEDVFSTYLYTGNGSTQTITNGIDLSTKGGLVWLKSRSGSARHEITNTIQGTSVSLSSNLTNGAMGTDLTGFTTSGFTLGYVTGNTNFNGVTNVSWTFRKQAKFFDVVTYTGNGANRTIAHNLGSVPGCIIVKRTDAAADWPVFHMSSGAGNWAKLNTTAVFSAESLIWNNTSPTSTVFSVGTATAVNANGGTYVAYLFAHNAGGFGASGSDNVISCGTYSGNSNGVTVTLGYEPQWILIKAIDTVNQGWAVFDNMCGLSMSGTSPYLSPNTANAQTSLTTPIELLPNGFKVKAVGSTPSDANSIINYNDGLGDYANYAYIAIRRGPMKTPTSGTSVFTSVSKSGASSSVSSSPVSVVDLAITKAPQFDSDPGTYTTGPNLFCDRLRGLTGAYASVLNSTSTVAEYSASLDDVNAITSYAAQNRLLRVNAPTALQNAYWFFRRAPGFFDEVCYTGTGSNTTQAHNLGVVPELMIIKQRDSARNWPVYFGSASTFLNFNLTSASGSAGTTVWNSTAPTSTLFSIGTSVLVNSSGGTYVAYLFASCPGVSKVGSYTGTGALQTVNCGFTSGARFVLIKRTDSTGDWWVYDSARGITSGNDPYLLLNSTAAEVTGTNYVDTDTTGFKVTAAAPAGLNANGGTYIFLAIA